jgi:hypothetical protein
MTYGYGDPNGGWPPSEPDPAPRGRRRAPDDEDLRSPGSYGAPDRAPRYGSPVDERTSQWGGTDDRGWGAPPPARRGEEPPTGEPRRGQSPLTDRYVPRRPETPGARPPAGDERGRGEPRPTLRPPQAWQTDLADERGRQRGYPDRGYPEEPPRQRGYPDDRGYGTDETRPTTYGRPRVNQFGIGAPIDPRTRPGYPPRPRTGDDYYDDDERVDTRRPVREPARKRGPWLSVLAVLAAVTLLAVCGVGFYVTFLGPKPGADGANGASVHDISNQTIDPAPLTVAEVFPATTINVAAVGDDATSAPPANPSASTSGAPAGVQPYTVVKAEATECKNAVVGDLATLLTAAGCSQVVRATLTTADQQYVVTTGLFNLRDEAAAKEARDGVKTIVNATKGRFTGFMAGGVTDVIGRAKTQLAWDVRGHFMIYCVIARADSGEPDAKNPTVTQMVTDLVETYLNETVLTNRTLSPPPVPSSTASSAVPGGSASAKK